jgi:hypothetical protein
MRINWLHNYPDLWGIFSLTDDYNYKSNIIIENLYLA